MKKSFLFFINITAVLLLHAQQPVKWDFTAEQINDSIYILHLTATLKPSWHIYSQTSPANGPLATRITFHKNPLLTYRGKIKENGRLEKKFEETFQLYSRFFSGKVDFVQEIRQRGKTSVGGFVQFMACNDHECLTPEEVPFMVKLE